MQYFYGEETVKGVDFIEPLGTAVVVAKLASSK